MDSKVSTLKESLDDADLDRLSFVVYKKAMTLIGYTVTVLAMGLAVFAFFGFDKWKDISAQLNSLEGQVKGAEKEADTAVQNASMAQTQLAALKDEIEKNKSLFKGALNEALVETGRMRQVGTEAAELKAQIDTHQREALQLVKDAQASTQNSVKASLTSLQSEMDESVKSRAEVKAFQESIGKTSTAVSNKVDRSLDAGFTVLILQDKHSTSIAAKGSDVKISLGDARDGAVKSVMVNYGPGPKQNDSKGVLKPNDEISFIRLDTDGKTRKYTFRILDINMLAFRDLVTCELRWELEADAKIAQAGS